MSLLTAYFIIGMMMSAYIANIPGIEALSSEERTALLVTALLMWPLLLFQ